MHKLGDQWIEIVDGQEHMFKAVEQAKTINADVCGGCYFGVCGDICHDGALHVCGYGEGKCPLDNVDWVIKDLGMLNEYGCLPSDFGVYPEVYEHTLIGIDGYMVKAYTSEPHIGKYAWGETEQQAIDAWNRRT